MRISQLRLENFKIFKKATIDFRPLTILTGTNSSGKSTILNAISAVLHTQQPHMYPFEFLATGKNCSLGSYKDIINGKNTRDRFLVGLSIGEGNNLESIDARYRYSSSGNQTLLDKLVFKSGTTSSDGIELVWSGQQKGYRALIQAGTHNKMLKNKDAYNELKNLLFSLAAIGGSRKGKKLAEKEFVKTFKKQHQKWFRLSSRNPLEIIEELNKQPAGGFTVSLIKNIISNISNTYSYIGPVRVYPSRFYPIKEAGQVIDPTGENSIALLYEWKKYFPKKYNEVIKAIQLLELASKVDANSGMDGILKLDIQPYDHKERVSFADVGFGISQILPVLIADVALPKNGTLIVNQPEVHLHPASQALLGDYFISRLKYRNYILETHSEYLINRLRLLAVKGAVNIKDVSILFIDSNNRGNKNPKIYNIELSKDGSLLNAPKKFFETYYLDTFKLATGV